MKYPATPMLDKLKSVAPLSQQIGDFIAWLHEQKVVFSCYQNDILIEKRMPMERLLAQYFEIDLEAVERERRQILDYVRSVAKLEEKKK